MKQVKKQPHSASPKTVNYEALSAELQAITLELQRDDVELDMALEHYQRGLEVIRLLETYLQTTKNKVSELKAGFDAE